MDIRETMREIREICASKGWDSAVVLDPGKFSEKMLLVITEISEATEEFRNHHGVREIYYTKTVENRNPEKPEGVPIELADAVIRIFDFCEANAIDLEAALRLKIDYNRTRPHKHGGKVM